MAVNWRTDPRQQWAWTVTRGDEVLHVKATPSPEGGWVLTCLERPDWQCPAFGGGNGDNVMWQSQMRGLCDELFDAASAAS